MRSGLRRRYSQEVNKLHKSVGNKKEIDSAYEKAQQKPSQYLKIYETKKVQDKRQKNLEEEEELIYHCGCGFITKSMKCFRDHILFMHKGLFIENSSHYLTEKTHFVFKSVNFSQNQNERAKNKRQNEFKPVTLRCKDFVLEFNPSFKFKWFFCGKCESMFYKTIDFIYHCVGTCQHFDHPNSSHFIYDEEDWDQKQLVKPRFQPKQTIFDQGGNLEMKALRLLSQHEELIKDQTLKKIKQWQSENFITQNDLFINKTYKIFGQFIIIRNFSKKKQLEGNKWFFCNSCNQGFKNRIDLFLNHLTANCINYNEENSFFIFWRAIFYDECKQILINIINSKTLTIYKDKLFITQTIENGERHRFYNKDYQQRYFTRKLYFKILYGLISENILNYYPDHSNIVNSENFYTIKVFIQSFVNKQSRCQFALVELINNTLSNQINKKSKQQKTVALCKRSKLLQSQMFYCNNRCQNRDQMDLIDFIDHINEHHGGRIVICF